MQATQLLDEIITLLRRQEACFDAMIVAKEAERVHFGVSDHEAMLAGVAAMEVIVRDIEDIEERRALAIAGLAEHYDVPAGQLTVARLAERAGGRHQAPLMEAARRLSGKVADLDLANGQNAVVLSENINAIHETLLALAECGERGLEAYTRVGEAPIRPGGPARLVDRKV